MGTFSKKIKLTKTAVDNAEPVVTGDGMRQRVLFDTGLSGFGVVVGAKTKTFFAQRGNRRVTIGRYSLLTVDEARKRAINELLKLDGRPSTEPAPPAASETITLREGLELMLQTMRAKGRAPKTIKDYVYGVNNYLADWLDRPLASITREDANKKHHQIAADIAAGKYATVTPKNGKPYTKERHEGSGHSAANGVMRTFRAIYNRAARQYEGFPENPCVNVDWYREEERDAAIPEKDLPRWYAEVLGLDNPVRRDYLLFTLFTGLRRNNAAAIRWDEIEFDNRALLVSKFKGRPAFHLPLSDYLINLLKARRNCDVTNAVYPKSIFVFPAESKSGHISEPKVKLSVPFSIHGLRHTFITQAYQLGIPEPIISVLVNHSVSARSSRKITRGYYTPDFDYLRGPMQTITDRLRSLCEGEAKTTKRQPMI